MQKSELRCLGRCDGLGDLDPNGSYVRINVYAVGGTTHGIVISEGSAELLAAEISGALAQQAYLTWGGRRYTVTKVDAVNVYWVDENGDTGMTRHKGFMSSIRKPAD